VNLRAQAAAPLIRPAATFSPRCAKGEGVGGVSCRSYCAGLCLVRILYEAQPNKVLSPGRLLREAVMAAEVEG